MRALVKTERGPGHMELKEMPVPALEDGDVLIRVKAAGICGSDIRTRRLGTSVNLRPPVILGHEFAGVIEAVGGDGGRFRPGQRVVSDNTGDVCGACDMCAQGNYMMCRSRIGLGVGMDGGFADYVKIPGKLLKINPHTLFEIPDSLSFEEATLMDPVCNAYKAVIEEGHLMAGQDICIFGLGTIGLLCIKMAALSGAAHIVAVNRSKNPLRIQAALAMGATEVICTEGGENLDEIRRAAGNELYPLVIDCAGKNEILRWSLSLLQKGGSFIKVGYDAGPIGVSLDDFVNRGIRIQGHFAYDYMGWKRCLGLMAMGKLDVKPLITDRFPLERWKEAFDLQEMGRAMKAVFHMEEGR